MGDFLHSFKSSYFCVFYFKFMLDFNRILRVGLVETMNHWLALHGEVVVKEKLQAYKSGMKYLWSRDLMEQK